MKAAAVASPPRLLPDWGGLLLPDSDPWGDAGLLHLPASSTPIKAEPQSLRSFIAEAYPRYGFHRWADVLIELLQQVADGQLSRLIVTCQPRLGKSLLVSKLFRATSCSATRTCLRRSPPTQLNWPMPTPEKRATSTG